MSISLGGYCASVVCANVDTVLVSAIPVVRSNEFVRSLCIYIYSGEPCKGVSGWGDIPKFVPPGIPLWSLLT